MAKAWTRWQDWAEVGIGVLVLLSPLVVDTTTRAHVDDDRARRTDRHRRPRVARDARDGYGEWFQMVLGALLFISPWVIGYTELTAASWVSLGRRRADRRGGRDGDAAGERGAPRRSDRRNRVSSGRPWAHGGRRGPDHPGEAHHWQRTRRPVNASCKRPRSCSPSPASTPRPPRASPNGPRVPKGLVHYYFRRKTDLLAALVQRLPDGTVDARRVVVVGDIAESLRRLVAALDARLERVTAALSHLLWREADTHTAVRDALHDRYQSVVARRSATSSSPPVGRRWPRRTSTAPPRCSRSRSATGTRWPARGSDDDRMDPSAGARSCAERAGA